MNREAVLPHFSAIFLSLRKLLRKNTVIANVDRACLIDRVAAPAIIPINANGALSLLIK